MAKISGEAIPDMKTMKWGYVIFMEDGQIMEQSDFLFNTQIEAEDELLRLMQEYVPNDSI